MKLQLIQSLLQIRFDKIDGFIRIYGKTQYLTLLGSENYDAVYNRIRYLITLKNSIIFFLTILQKSNFEFMILYYRKKIDFTYCYDTH